MNSSEARSKEGLDWRDWSGLESIDYLSSLSVDEIYDHMRWDMRTHFGVAPQCADKWLEYSNVASSKSEICICGHPEITHKDSGLCVAGVNVCFCRGHEPVVIASGILTFFSATKGPHESHALLRGLYRLRAVGGSFSTIGTWLCSDSDCRRSLKVGPVRMRNRRDLSLHLSVTDQNKMLCERCLFIRLNGGM